MTSLTSYDYFLNKLKFNESKSPTLISTVHLCIHVLKNILPGKKNIKEKFQGN